MFILANIKAKTPDQLFKPGIKKYLKFQTNQSLKRHPFPSKFVNSHELVWDAELSFPEEFYGRSLPFQLYQKHTFGYNQQELEGVYSGKIKIDKKVETFSVEIYSQLRKQIVGYLSGRIKHKVQTVEKVIEKVVAHSQILRVKSIVAHIPEAVNKKIFFKINIANHELKTPSVRSFCGDLVFAEPMQIEKLDIQVKGLVTIWEIKGEVEVKIGEGTMSYIGERPNKKVTLFSLNQELLGEAYVDSHQESKEELKKKSNSLPSYLTKISPKKMMERTSISQFSSNGFAKRSVVNSNKNIVFTTERRFKDTPNPETFSKTRSFQQSRRVPFSQVRANRIFNKTNQLSSIQQESPGVGDYVLPSIWDRY